MKAVRRCLWLLCVVEKIKVDHITDRTSLRRSLTVGSYRHHDNNEVIAVGEEDHARV